VKTIQRIYERNEKVVDAEKRASFSRPKLFKELNADQMSLATSCFEMEKEVVDISGKFLPWNPLKSSSPFVTMKIKKAPPKQGERRLGLGMAEAVVDCPAHLAAAWLFAYNSRERKRINEEEGNPARLVVCEYSLHDWLVATIKKFPFPLNHREFVMRQLLYVDDETGDYVLAQQSVPDKIDYGFKMKAVRGTARVLFRLSPVSEKQCRVTNYQNLDAGGNIPTAVMESKFPEALSILVDIREVF
jgi:hypothetical protein